MKDIELKEDEEWAVYVDKSTGACTTGWYAWDGENLYPVRYRKSKEEWYRCALDTIPLTLYSAVFPDSEFTMKYYEDDVEDWNGIADQLVAEGYLPIDYDHVKKAQEWLT